MPANNPEYSGTHQAPSRDGYSAPLYDVSSTGIYPEDIYGPHGAQYYGHYGSGAKDFAAIRVIHSYHNRPDAVLTIYRAVPAQNADKLALLEKQMREYMRRGRSPENSRLSGSAWYNDASEMAAALRAAPAEEITIINPGDWVTTVRAYAIEHGESALEGAYRVISKKVRARDLWTDGNSIFEFRYDPSDIGSNPPRYPLADKSEWYGDADFESRGGILVSMHPQEFLAAVRPLKINESSRDNIESLKAHILSGGVLDPLIVYPDGKEDGRHRAQASIELGITEVPVIIFPA